MYFVKITPIIPNAVLWKGPFYSESAAWRWVEENNSPYCDFDVIEDTVGNIWEDD